MGGKHMSGEALDQASKSQMSSDSQRSVSVITSQLVPSTARPDVMSTVVATVPATMTGSLVRNTEAIPSIPVFPFAAIVIVLVAVFVFIVAVILIVRKSLKMKGVCVEVWQPDCHCCASSNSPPSCREQVLKLAQAVDCDLPSCQVWMDNICPSQAGCAAAWSRIWGCGCCVGIKEACQGWCVCPTVGPMECPDCACCGDCCHCTLRVPECSHVTCLCFECGKPDRTSAASL